ncbi:hypothetical protein Adt_26755 [Abeliophyllum distichum]|uniref:Uncharacterized protein n=1 Tax=Abeliophyllum distichum TaxID=126358 RepID=A0ABD1RRT3_9LAMI
MSGRIRGRPRIEHSNAPSQEMAEEEQPPSQFAIVEQVTILQNQMSTIMEMLQRMTAPPHILEVPSAVEVPPAIESQPTVEVLPTVEILPTKTIQTHEMTYTSRHSIPVNWESILSEKVEEAIAQRKSRGRPISIKEDSFTEEMPSVITALLSGLRNHGFRVILSKKSPESMMELLRRGEEYVDQEEVLKATRGDRDIYDSGSKKRRDEPPMSKSNTRGIVEYKYRPRT